MEKNSGENNQRKITYKRLIKENPYREISEIEIVIRELFII